MFTGIVEEVGTVERAAPDHLVIHASKVLGDLKISDSICVNGACLTVTSRTVTSFSADVVPETLRRTNLGLLRIGDPVDLERPVAVGGRLDGHLVQGHVDATGRVRSINTECDALLVEIAAPPAVMRYVVEKGFISVDGVSLTVVDCDSESFTVTIVPFTRDNTIFATKKVGESVNLETDIVAKYVERLSTGLRRPVDAADGL